MRVLFLTRKFAPQNYIGAIRPTKLAKYLVRNFGHQIDVICMEDTGNVTDSLINDDTSDIEHIKILPYCRWTTFIQKKYSEKASCIKREGLNKPKSSASAKIGVGIVKRYLRSVARNMLYLVMLYDNYRYARRSIRCIKKIAPVKGYDAFFSTTSLPESYMIGRWLKKRYPEVRWVYDLRDPIRLSTYPLIARHIVSNMLKKTVLLVDVVTGVSSACVSEFKDAGHNDTSILTNGFDYDDLQSVAHMADRPYDGKLRIVYTGTLYDGKRDVTPLLLLLLELANESRIDLSKIELHYAGRDCNVLRSNIAAIGIDIVLVDHGFITRADSIRLQREADILLLMSWNSFGETGVVTGKFYEYLMIGKPICCFIKGDLPNSVLRERIEESGAGICYEEADIMTHEHMKDYLIARYNDAINNGTIQARDDSHIQKFNYKNLATELNSLLCKN